MTLDTCFQDALENFNTIGGFKFTIPDLADFYISSGHKAHVQRLLTEKFDEKRSADFLKVRPQVAPWFQSVSASESSKWFTGIPNPVYGTHILNSYFKYAVKIRLMIPVFGPDSFCSGAPDKRVYSIDKLGHHALGCPRGGGTHSRHHEVSCVILEEAKAAGLQPRSDCSNLIPLSQSRPADIFIPIWSQNRGIALDVSIVVPPRSYPTHSSAKDNAGLLGDAFLCVDDAYKLKRAKHSENCKSVNLLFEPIIFDVAGMCHPSSLAVLKDLSRRRAAREGSDDDFCVNRFLQRLSVAVQTGNGRAMLHHLDHLRLKSASLPEVRSTSGTRSTTAGPPRTTFQSPSLREKRIFSTAFKNPLSCHNISSGPIMDDQEVSDSEFEDSPDFHQAKCPKLPRDRGILGMGFPNNLSCYPSSIHSHTTDFHDGGSNFQLLDESDSGKIPKNSDAPATTGTTSQPSLSCYSSSFNEDLLLKDLSELKPSITRHSHVFPSVTHSLDAASVPTSQNRLLPISRASSSSIPSSTRLASSLAVQDPTWDVISQKIHSSLCVVTSDDPFISKPIFPDAPTPAAPSEPTVSSPGPSTNFRKIKQVSTSNPKISAKTTRKPSKISRKNAD
jgi:hypothetical protein